MVLEIHRIEARREEDGSWTWDSSQYCGAFHTRSYDVRRAIKRALAGMGIKLGGSRICVTFDGSRFEVCLIATGEPLYTAIQVTNASQGIKSSSGRNTP
jgi:hypothetical protein